MGHIHGYLAETGRIAINAVIYQRMRSTWQEDVRAGQMQRSLPEEPPSELNWNGLQAWGGAKTWTCPCGS